MVVTAHSLRSLSLNDPRTVCASNVGQEKPDPVVTQSK
jgi:hypothetical protein